MKASITNKLRGLLLCFIIAIVAWYIGKQYPVIGGPITAIIIGMFLNQIMKDKDKYKQGVTFTTKKILQYAVILLGFGLNLSSIIKTGITSLPIIAATIATSLILSFILYKLIKIPRKTAILIGVGSSICGGSAIAATAPVIGAKDEEIAESISVIFLFNVIAALIFPTLGTILGISNEGFGVFAGTAINDTSSVTAAASAWDGIHNTGTQVLDIATIVKLTRTLAIIPITLVLSIHQSKQNNNSIKGRLRIKRIFPTFILYFVLASIVTTILTSVGVASELFAPLKDLSKFFIIMAMAGIGFNTSLVKLIKNGGKPILQGFICWISISMVSLIMQMLLGTW